MCLDSDPEEIKRLLNYKRIDCYKIACCHNGKLSGYFQLQYEYQPGWNHSNSTDPLYCSKYTNIFQGIHVFLCKPELSGESEHNPTCYFPNVNYFVPFCQYFLSMSEHMRQKFASKKIRIPELYSYCRVIRCKAFISDLIGANKYKAVFKKIYIPKVNYKKCA